MKHSLCSALAIALFISCAHHAGAPPEVPAFRHANVRGADLEYAVLGRGEPVLLIHGAIFGDAFLPILRNPAFSRYRLITFHRRGFAGSERAVAPYPIREQAADAHALLQYLGINCAHVVGHSYGGAIGVQLALDHPESVGSLSLLEPSIFDESPSTGKLFEEIGGAVTLHQKGDDRAAIDRFVTAVIGPGYRAAIDQNLGPAAFDAAVATAPTFFDIEMPALQAWSFDPKSLNALEMPVLLVVGRESRDVFVEAHTALRRRIPRAEELTIPNATHALQIMNPDPVAEGLARFFKQHPVH